MLFSNSDGLASLASNGALWRRMVAAQLHTSLADDGGWLLLWSVDVLGCSADPAARWALLYKIATIIVRLKAYYATEFDDDNIGFEVRYTA